MPYSIYTLSDPFSGDIFYVGLTLNLRKRTGAYKFDRVDKKARTIGIQNLAPRDYFIFALKANPLIHVIDEVFGNVEKALEKEKFWIRFLLDNGFPLVNIHSTCLEPNGEVNYFRPKPIAA